MKDRPLRVTLVAMVLLVFAAAGLARLIQTLRLWEMLVEMLLIHPIVLAVSGLFWFVAGGGLGMGLLAGLPWARRLTPPAILVFTAYFWFERIILSVNPERNQNAAFVAGLNVLLAAGCMWVLSHKRVKLFFEERYERESKNRPAA